MLPRFGMKKNTRSGSSIDASARFALIEAPRLRKIQCNTVPTRKPIAARIGGHRKKPIACGVRSQSWPIGDHPNRRAQSTRGLRVLQGCAGTDTPSRSAKSRPSCQLFALLTLLAVFLRGRELAGQAQHHSGIEPRCRSTPNTYDARHEQQCASRSCIAGRGRGFGPRLALRRFGMTVGFGAQFLQVYQPPAPAVRGGSSRPASASRRLRNSRTL